MPEKTTFDPSRIVLAVHGGAGTISRATLSDTQEALYRGTLRRALRAGHEVLAGGGNAVDAVVAAVSMLEDDPLFNAGKGAVFTHDGRNELDAAIMDGHSGQAGAVAGITTVKNPVVAARAVMQKTHHVLLVGSGAEAFAAEQQLEIVPPSYFFTEHRWEQLEKSRAAQRVELDHDGRPERGPAQVNPFEPWLVDNKFGTVGAVALDGYGDLAAATSTGGLSNKLYGRIGDSAIIGAGTYADNATTAVSATGAGEFFMRGVVAYDIAARMKYAAASLGDAVDQTLKAALDDRQGKGGVIALAADGTLKFGFNTEGMYRGCIRADGEALVDIYKA